MPSDLNRDITSEVSSYIANSGKLPLPEAVITKTKHHILDTIASITFGSTLKPGQVAKKYAESRRAEIAEAQVIGTSILSSAVEAALINGIMAHADETDDFDPRCRIHPGAAIIPAALAIAEAEHADGMAFLRGVVVGYDVGCRILLALGPDNLARENRVSFGIGGSFGAAAAASSILGLTEFQVRYALSYTAQQASGMPYWARDEEHIEKAFLFGGMPARNGATAAALVRAGFTGVRDSLSGESNFFFSISPDSRPELLLQGIGSQYEIMNVYIKKFPVGGPIQAALDALLLLIERYKLKPTDIETIIVHVPSSRVVDSRNMPDINLQYLVATTMLEAKLTTEAAHSYERMNNPDILEMKRRVLLKEDTSLSVPGAMRQARVEIADRDGNTFKEHVVHVRGAAQNPMTTLEVEEKCHELLEPVIGTRSTRQLIKRIRNLENVQDMRELRPLLSAPQTHS
jgi:2-methylcitrate dehydratase PrpD